MNLFKSESLVSVGAVSTNDPRLKIHSLHKEHDKFTELQLLSREEIFNVLEHYRALGLIHQQDVSGMYLEKKRFVSDGIFGKLLKACCYDSVL